MNITSESDLYWSALVESNYLTDISPRDKPWDQHRAEAVKVEILYEKGGATRYARRMEECSRLLDFALTVADEGELKLRLQGARFCRVRHCPVCQWRRTLMWQSRFHKAIPKLMQDHPNLRFLFLTLTVRNCEIQDLRAQLNKMNSAWIRLTRRVDFTAVGWVKSVEVTRGDDGSAHPHFHCMLAVKSAYFQGTNYLSHEKWTKLWQESLQIDYVPILHVQTVKLKRSAKKGKVLSDQIELSSVEAVMSAVKETLKYSVKSSDLIADKEWLMELTGQLHKTKAVSLGGLFKAYLSEEDPEDLIHTELEEDEVATELGHILFDWIENGRRYRQRQEE